MSTRANTEDADTEEEEDEDDDRFSSQPQANPGRQPRNQHLDFMRASSTRTMSSSNRALPIVEVTAPATLSAGYSFVAQMGVRTFDVKVPEGGVIKGQKFLVAVPSDDVIDERFSLPKFTSSVPLHRWKDGLCACLRYGLCHPMLCWSCCCPAIALAQIMTRMQLTWCGHPGSPAEAPKTFRKVFALVLIFFTVDTILSLAIQSSILTSAYPSSSYPQTTTQYYNTATTHAVKISDNSTTTTDIPTTLLTLMLLRRLVNLVFWIYLIYTMTKTRTYVRTKYDIPGTECEDCCCSVCCTCCIVSQMGRHTADYDLYHGVCCSETGLPMNVEIV